MADSTISQLPVATALQPTDSFPVAQSGVTKQVPFSLLAGLTAFQERFSSSAPNDVIPVSGFAAKGLFTNIDVSLSPKGNGAVAAQIADNGILGGNKRGRYAVDWQLVRDTSSQVASGIMSGILSGGYNIVTTNYSVIAGGVYNSITGGGNTCGIFCGGNNSIFSGDYSVISGGSLNSMDGSGPAGVNGFVRTATYSVIAGGSSNFLNSDFAIIPGGSMASTRGLPGAMSWAGTGGRSGLSSVAVGDYQSSKFILFCTSFSNSVARNMDLLCIPSGALANPVILPDHSLYSCKLKVMAKRRQTSAVQTLNCKTWECTFLINRGAGASTTVLIGAPVTTDTSPSSTFTGGFTVTADTALGAIKIACLGGDSAAVGAQWIAELSTLEIVESNY